MKATIQVSEVLHAGAITGRHSGRVIRESAVAALIRSSIVVIDFSDVDVITQSAADEFIGRMVRQHPEIIGRISFSNCSPDVAGMLQWAAENANAVSQAGPAMVAA
jgi:anti-anti-sigma regulatory factor